MGIAREDGRPNPQQSRPMRRKLIDGRTIVHPREESAELEFRCALGKLIAGLHVPKAVVTPAGSARFRLTVPLRTVFRRAA